MRQAPAIAFPALPLAVHPLPARQPALLSPDHILPRRRLVQPPNYQRKRARIPTRARPRPRLQHLLPTRALLLQPSNSLAVWLLGLWLPQASSCCKVLGNQPTRAMLLHFALVSPSNTYTPLTDKRRSSMRGFGISILFDNIQFLSLYFPLFVCHGLPGYGTTYSLIHDLGYRQHKNLRNAMTV
ncbi:hypothetical protein BO71DRAFT_53427 [Aspergillus ellipticus CBS 707.79]|uniref:Uncharacterized protein n=1 Tax=Aspergillus ellipticus CBS 707.79 TaxID=1448320 RepID=A0A319DA82_9EURO|nr:hypothetical protein BO71DRAFT_53427 [Aspergillus ellipticus CBS 707.79]